MTPGHLFILRGDIRRLKCDAWALPTDRGMRITTAWSKDAPQHVVHFLAAVKSETPSWRRSTFIDPRTWNSPKHCTTWLIDTGSVAGQRAEWFGERLESFLAAAAKSTRRTTSMPMIAVPFVGSGAGGAEGTKGELLRDFMPRLERAAQSCEVDVALVFQNPAAFAAAQAWRKGRRCWALPRRLLQAAQDLAARKNLVLFLGAGVSKGADLPDWSGLLGSLAAEAGLNKAAQSEFTKLHPLDQASFLEQRFASTDRSIGDRVASRMTVEQYSVTHGLLASLPANEYVTTNYDALFEAASRAAGHPLSVVPYESVTSGQRWLLKLHGTIDANAGRDIVLARSDYLGYDAQRGALAGIVQALLLTRHMLFVGFSLTDDNFHRMVHAVRQVLASQRAGCAEDQRLGTALALSNDALSKQLWSDVIDIVPVADKPDDADASRRLAIFLDCLLHHAARKTDHLLDETFGALVKSHQLSLVSALTALQANTDRATREALADLLDALESAELDEPGH